MCSFVGGFSFVFARGEKKQNKSPSNCTALSTEHQSNQSIFCNNLSFYIVLICLGPVFTLAYNVRVYEPLRCHSALWSSYHKVTKRTNPRKPAASNGLYTLLCAAHNTFMANLDFQNRYYYLLYNLVALEFHT
jgi:hypothetical protein